jgi:peptide/nickel transport system substrate-binding protein
MRKRLLFFLLVGILLFPLTSLNGQDDETIVIRGFGNIVTFNPLMTSDGASYQAYSLLFPAPVDVDSFTGEPIPGLTSWTVSDDGLTYTFTINENAIWSDGTPITSDDMIFTIGAIQNEEIATSLESNVALVSAVNRVDDKTYEVVLSQPDCAAIGQLGGIRFLPAHRFEPDYSDFLENSINTNPDISGGPYILEEWAPDEGQRFRANPDFWAGAPNIPFLVNRVVGEQTVALQAIQAGEIDYTYFQGDLFQQIENTENLQYQFFPQLSVNFLSLNWVDPENPQPAYDEEGNLVEQTPHPIFSDVNVRKAVAMGYNKADILETLGGETGGTRLVGVVAPTITWAYNTDLEPYPYDPEMAQQLLEEAGWVDSDGDGVREKDGVPLAFTIRYSNILNLFETTALVAQDQLSQIGFSVELELVEWANYIEDVYFGQNYDATPMSNSGGTAPPDPNDFTTLILSTEDVPGGGNNLASYVNPEIDELIEQARSVPGCATEDRAEIYNQIQALAHEDVAYDWTFTPNVYQVANQRIGNFEPGPAWVFYGYTGHVHKWTLDGNSE